MKENEAEPIVVFAAMDSDGHFVVADPHNLEAMWKLLRGLDDGAMWSNVTDELDLQIKSKEQFIEFVNSDPHNYKRLIRSFCGRGRMEEVQYQPSY